MRKNGVAQRGIRDAGAHRDLHGSHDFSCANCKGGEAENTVTLSLNQSLQKSSRFRKRAGAHYRCHRHLEQAVSNGLSFRFPLTESEAGEFRNGKKTDWDLSSCSHALGTSETGVHHTEIVNTDAPTLRLSTGGLASFKAW